MTRQTVVAWLIFFVLKKYGFLLYKKNNIGKMDSFEFIEAIRIKYKKLISSHCNKNKIKMLERKQDDLILFSWTGCFSFLDTFLLWISHPEVKLYKLFIC